MKNAKVKKLLLSAVSIMLVATLAVAGTVAYLQDSTEDVVNTFNMNNVSVDLKETTGDDYNIVPGTSEKKDPAVTVSASLPAYVYVEVTDETQGLVTYEIAEGWTKLDGYDNVYYREFTPTEGEDGDTAVYEVLKDNQVSYAASLTNEDMKDEEGNPKTDIQLTFKAYAIQKEGFDTAKAGWLQIPAEVSTGAELYAALAEGKPVVLANDINLNEEAEDECTYTTYTVNGTSFEILNEDWQEIVISQNCDIDLGGNTLTLRGAVTVKDGAEAVITNGDLKFALCEHIAKAWALSFDPVQVIGGSLTLNDVTIEKVSSSRAVSLAKQGDSLTINGGTINGVITLYAGTAATVNDAVLNSGDAFQMYSDTTLDINNATVTCTHLVKALKPSMTATININGGTYTVTSETDPLIWGTGKTSANITKTVTGNATLNGDPFSWE